MLNTSSFVRWLLLPVIVALLLASGPACRPATPPLSAATQTVAQTGASSLNAQRIIGADSEPHNWLAHGRTYDEQRHSPL